MPFKPTTTPPTEYRQTHPTCCWKELLNNAFSGWMPAEQAVERIIDRVEHGL